MKLKRIGLAILSLSALACLASCGESEAENAGIAPKVETVENTTLQLAAISLNTENVQKVFYVGDAFNYNNLTITRRFLRVENGTEKILDNNVTDESTYYFVDSSNVDMNNVGTYYVYVSTRFGANTRRESYKIEIKSSLFETTPNITYASGLDVTFADGSRIKEYLLNSTELDKNALVSGLKIKLHKNVVDANGKAKDESSDLSASQVKIDSSTVKNNEVGTYLIKVTYDNGKVTVNGKQYDNIVTTFVVVNVANPIKSITVKGGNAVFDASIDGIDPEKAGWTVTVTPTVGSPYTEPFSNEKYSIDGIDIFNWGKNQDATISLKSDPTVKFVRAIRIQESTTQDIKAYYTLIGDVSKTETYVTSFNSDGNPNDILLAGTDYIHGPLPAKVDNDIYYNSGATYVSRDDGKDKYGSISFGTRVSIKGTGQAFKFDMKSAGQIVVFYASTGDEERDITLYSDNNGSIGEEMATANTPDTKQVITRVTFNIDKAGTYYIANAVGGIYVHGFLVALNK